MTYKKAKSPPILSEMNVKKIKKDPSVETAKVNPGDIAGSIFAIDGGINVIADLLNDKITNVQAANKLFELGVHKPSSDPNNPEPISKQSVQYHKNRVKKRLGIKNKKDANVYYVPFITSETATNYLNKAQKEINDIDSDHATSQNLKIDPILGLHMMALELDSLAETVQLDFKETLQLKKLKMLIFEKLNKLDDDKEKDITKKQLIKKLDDLSRFHADYHIFINAAYKEIVDKITALIGQDNQDLPQIEQYLLDFKKMINIKDKYLDYIKTINISGEELATIFETQEEFFQTIDIDEALEV
jgi:hypothetical protein|tara:strand:- start:210 stop:1115 length:906 start_codon:yes stop_codon:yes gene_type:complete